MTLTIRDACVAANVGRSTLYEAISNGSLIARKLGKKTLILPADLQSWLENLPSFTPWQKPKVKKS